MSSILEGRLNPSKGPDRSVGLEKECVSLRRQPQESDAGMRRGGSGLKQTPPEPARVDAEYTICWVGGAESGRRSSFSLVIMSLNNPKTAPLFTRNGVLALNSWHPLA